MSTGNDGESHYQNHQKAAELHNAAEHAHLVAEQHHDKQDHLSGAEHSRQTHEHSGDPHQSGHANTVGHGIVAFGHAEIAALAYELWQARGCPEGSADEDWYHAAEQLRARAFTPR
jgi:hypothetical protein